MQWTSTLIVLISVSLNACKTRSIPSVSTTLAVAPGPQISVESLRQRVASGDPSVGWMDVPLIRQSRSFTCGAASLASALYAIGPELVEGQIQRLARTAFDAGTDFREMMKIVLALNNAQLRQQMLDIRAYDEIFDPRTILKSLDRSLNDDYNSDHVRLPTLRKRSQAASLTQEDEDLPVKSSKRTTARPQDIIASSSAGFSVAVKFGYKAFNGERPQDCPRHQAHERAELKELSDVTLEKTSLQELEAAIRQGHPVIALIQAWAELSPQQYETSYSHGHYVVVNGFDEQNIYIMDPATLGQYTYMSRRDFERRWHDYAGDLSASGERCPGGYEMQAFSMILSGAKNADFDSAVFSRLD